ncbi:helix-turn-helix domain-containing protein [Streptomyces sp. NPDC088350]|uniref:helix-turn-helix domain-containing protein n=1 Tax=Streptomyces sp. NPDC088350 TaxID=3365854 RepID=UPI003811C709
MSTGAGAEASRGAFLLDSTRPDAAPRGFDAFRHQWETQLGGGFRLPVFSPDTTGHFRVRSRGTKVHDVAITDLHGISAVRAAATPRGHEDQVRIYVVRRGAWTLGDRRGHSRHTVAAGQILLRHFGPPSAFETAPNTSAQILFLPAALLRPLLGNRIVTGPADSVETRLLTAHMAMVQGTLTALGPAGVQAAHSTLIELAKAVALRRFDDVEPLLAPALTQAAKNLANSRLAEPELSPATLAHELNVSLRTLQRAFAAVGESVTAYIRHRRLEEARLALTAPRGRPNVSELAAYWHFADSSHFTRAFKKRYGQTPTAYARRPSTPTDIT